MIAQCLVSRKNSQGRQEILPNFKLNLLWNVKYFCCFQLPFLRPDVSDPMKMVYQKISQFTWQPSSSSFSAGASSTGAGAGSSALGSSLTATKRPIISLDLIILSPQVMRACWNILESILPS